MKWVRAKYAAVRVWFWKRRVNRSLRLLDELDWHLQRVGWTRHDRRKFWRDFQHKQATRTEVLNRLTQE